MPITEGKIRIMRPESGEMPFRLGEHLFLDGRSVPFAVEKDPAAMAATPRSVDWGVHLPILDQGKVGSCVGNTATEALGADPVWETLPDSVKVDLDQDYAYRLYSDATRIDGYLGVFTYPPAGGQDTGTWGIAACKVAKKRGLISGYRWALSMSGLLRLLQDGPVLWGTAWHRQMFHPDHNGFVKPKGPIDGGHEVLIRAADVKNADSDFAGTVLTCRNHWTSIWGDGGEFRITIEDVKFLRSEGCDFKQFVPFTG
jgi:hypothetical protein